MIVLLGNLDKFLNEVKKPNKENEYITNIEKAINRVDEYNNQSFSIDQQGRSHYKYNDATWAHSNWKARETLKNGFWTRNPLLAKHGQMHAFITHHANLQLSRNRISTVQEEQFLDYFARQFGAHLHHMYDRGHSIGWFYTIADKPKTHGIVVSGISTATDTQANDMIKEALLQELDIMDNENLKSDRMVKLRDQMKADLEAKAEDQRVILRFAKQRINGENVAIRVQDVKLNLDKTVKNIRAYFDHRAEILADQLDAAGYRMETNWENMYNVLADKDLVKRGLKSQKAIQKELVRNFYYNSYINKHFVNQMAVGSLHNYKHFNDMIKRIAGAFAPGTQPVFKKGQEVSYQLVGDTMFTHNEFSDPLGEWSNIYGSPITTNDAQEYRSYDAYMALAEAYGSAVNLGYIDKPVYFSVDENGEAVYVKSAVITLTPTIVSMFAKARRLSQKMGNRVMSVVPASGVKVGQHNMIDDTEMRNEVASPMQVTMEGLRQQLDPQTKIGKDNAIVTPSQIIYLLMNNASVNAERAYQIYSDLATIIRDRANRTFWQLKEDGVPNANKVAATIENLTKDSAINEVIYNLVKEFKGEALSLAGITNKAVELLLNKIYNDTVHIKFPGFKGNLVSDELVEVFDTEEGIAVFDSQAGQHNLTLTKEQRAKYITGYEADIKAFPEREPVYKLMKRLRYKGLEHKEIRKNLEEYFKGDDRITSEVLDTIMAEVDNPVIPRELIYNDKEGYAEVIMPDVFKNKLKPGVVYSKQDMYKMFGFRLPSTDLHSGVAIKVVGFYHEKHDVTSAIFAPKELVILHGSDFDADTLNVIIKAVHSKRAKPKQISEKLTYTPESVYGEVLGYDEELKEIALALPTSTDKQGLIKVRQKILMNRILHNLLGAMLDKGNWNEITTPLSFDPVLSQTVENQEELNEKLAKSLKRFVNDPKIKAFDKLDTIAGYNVRETNENPNDVLVDKQFHGDNADGKRMVGYFANGGKTIYMVMDPTVASKIRKVKPPEAFQVLEYEYDQFEDYEKYPGNKKGMRTTQLLDIYVNAATDATKEQMLNALNANPVTGSAMVVMTRHGVPMIHQALFLRSKPMRELVKAVRHLGSIKGGPIVLFDGELVLDLKRNQRNKLAIIKQIKKFAQTKTAKTDEEIGIPTLAWASDSVNRSAKEYDQADWEQVQSIMTQFERMESYGSDLTSVINSIGYLNTIPQHLGIIVRWLQNMEEISKEDFSFENNVMEIPHFKAIKEVLEEQMDIIRKTFPFQAESVYMRLWRTMKSYYIYDDYQQQEFVRGFERFVISWMHKQEAGKTWMNPETKITYTGVDAFIQRFISELDVKLNESSGNPFLSRLSVDPSRREYTNKGKRLRQVSINLKDIKPEEFQAAKAAMRELQKDDPEFIQDLLKYVILDKGIGFGNSSILSLFDALDLDDVIYNSSEILSENRFIEDPTPLLTDYLYQYVSATGRGFTAGAQNLSDKVGGVNSLITANDSAVPVLITQNPNPEDGVTAKGQMLVWHERYGDKDVNIYAPIEMLKLTHISAGLIDQDLMAKRLFPGGTHRDLMRVKRSLRFNPTFKHMPKSIFEGFASQQKLDDGLYGVYEDNDIYRNAERYFTIKNNKMTEMQIDRRTLENLFEKDLRTLADEIAKANKLEREEQRLPDSKCK